MLTGLADSRKAFGWKQIWIVSWSNKEEFSEINNDLKRSIYFILTWCKFLKKWHSIFITKSFNSGNQNSHLVLFNIQYISFHSVLLRPLISSWSWISNELVIIFIKQKLHSLNIYFKWESKMFILSFLRQILNQFQTC